MAEKNKDGWDNIRITPLDVIKAVGSGFLELFKLHQLSERSDHFNRGAAPMLDKMLDLTEPVEIPEDTQLQLDYYTLEQ